jgi:glycosyltransferase involved in cell wall biosynthesis
MIFRALLLIGTIVTAQMSANEKPIIVSVPSYNNMQFYKKNLDSIFAQEYGNYYVIYIDDCSTDGTARAVATYVKERNLEHKISIVCNPVRRGALFNHYMLAHAVPDAAIIVTVDGDDWLPDGNTKVFARVNEAYQDPNVWMTFGQFAEYPSGKKGFCRSLATCGGLQNSYRDYPWVMSHLRTYYAGLFKQIPVGYFIRNNDFLQATCDLAIMFSVLELSSGRVHYIDEVIYTYNTTNINSDCYSRQQEQVNNEHWVRARAPLQPLSEHPAYGTKKSMPALYNWHLSCNGVAACQAYCDTLAAGGIAPEMVTIFYDDTPDCRERLLAQLNELADDSFILLTTDGCTWQTPIDWHEAMKTITKTKALSYVLTRGAENFSDQSLQAMTKQPNVVWLYNQYYLWKPTIAQGAAHHPYAAPAVLIAKPQLYYALSQINGKTMRELLDNLAYLAAENSDDVMLCSAHAACSYQG